MTRDDRTEDRASRFGQIGEIDARMLVEGTRHFFFYIHDLEGDITYISPSVEGITGRSVEDWIGQHHWFTTDNPLNAVARRRTHEHIAGEFSAEPILVEVEHADGRAVILEAYESGVFEEGRLTAIQGIAHDVTEREHAEDRVALLAAAMHSTGDGICIADRGNIIRFVNNAFCTIYGRDRDALLGQNLALLRSDRNPEGTLSEVRRETLGGGWRGDLWNVRSDGSEFLVELTTSVVADDTGEPVAMIGIVRDVTETRRIESSERKRLKQLAVVNRIAHHVASLRNQSELLATAVKEIQQGFQYHNVVLLTVDEDAGLLCNQVIAGGYEDIAPPDYSQPLGAGLIGEAARTGASVMVNDVQSDPRWLRGFTEEIATRSELCVPVKLDGRVIAVLDVQETRADAFDSSDVQTLETLADQIAVSYDAARLIGELTRELAERQRAETALRESERALAALFANLPGMAYRCRNAANWTMELVSEGAQALTGYTPSELVGDRVVAYGDLIDPDDREMVWDEVQSALAADRPFELRYRIHTRSGEERWVWERGSGARDATGEVEALEGFINDITGLVRSERALRESERNYREIFDATTEAIFIHESPGGPVIDVNQSMLRMYGYDTKAEALARMAGDSSTNEPPFGRADAERHLRRAIEQGPQVVEWLATRKNGERFWTEVSLRSSEIGGRGRILAVVRDIDERKRTEQALSAERDRARRYLDLSPVLFVALDREGRVTLVNRRTCEFLERPEADIVGRKWFEEFVPEHERDRLLPFFNRLMMGELEQFEYVENPVLAGDGTERQIGWRNTLLRDPSGRVVGTLSAGEDLTERRALEEQLRHSQRLEAIGRLAGGVAHDFNNLLQAIVTRAELLRLETSDPEAIAGAADELQTHAHRGASLARQLLLFARRTVIQKERIELNELVETTSVLLRRLLRSNVHLALELSPDPLPVRADRGQLEQVLTNLALNSVDAMQEGGDIHLRTGGEDQQAWFEVEDTGFGMSDAVRERIFEPFFTTKEPGKGTGLGLAVVHGIVTQHGGQVEVESDPGSGSRFRVLLPRQLSETDEQTDSGARRAVITGNGERLLLVEDDDQIRASMARTLERIGYSVTVAASGEAAVDASLDGPIDLLISDVMLPGISGPEVARRLVARWPRLATVLISGYAEDEVLRREIFEGTVRFLQKPIDLASLAREVRGALDGRDIDPS